MTNHNRKTYSYNLEELKMERARQGKSIRELAEMAVLDPKTIMRIEKRLVRPRIQTVGRIALALNKDIADFINKDQADKGIEQEPEEHQEVCQRDM